MKQILFVLFAAASTALGNAQPKTATSFNCNEIKFWQTQLAKDFIGINTKVVDETELTSTRKIAGFVNCTYRKNEGNTFNYVDGTNNFTDYKAALLFYNKIKGIMKTCLGADKYKVYPEETEDQNKFQVSVKDYGKKGGYYQMRIQIAPAFKYEAEKELPNGFEVFIVMELRKVGAAG